MTQIPPWLPPLVVFKDYGGDWTQYLNAIYAYFKSDFIDRILSFKGRRVNLKRHPEYEGKEATFWHIISSGESEDDRIPDLRRCERIRWPRPIIENHGKKNVKVWQNKRRGETRICLWLEELEYLVVLADRKKYLLFWTAYQVDYAHQKRKLRKEYEQWKMKGGGIS